MPEATIIIPVYKVEKYIHRCIDSVINQTKKNIEIILVDDGSPDNCPAICDEYGRTDERIHVFHQMNSGVSVARNKGIEAANGKYITFIDSDDWVSEKYIEKMLAACEANNADICVMNTIRVSDELQAIEFEGQNEEVLNKRDAIEYFGRIADMRWRGPMVKLIRTEIVKKIRFPEGRAYSEDTACVYRWMWEANKVVSLDAKMYYYFNNPQSADNAAYSEKRLGLFETYWEMIRFFVKEDFRDLKDLYLAKYLLSCIDGYRVCNDNEIRNEIICYYQKALLEYAGAKLPNILSEMQLAAFIYDSKEYSLAQAIAKGFVDNWAYKHYGERDRKRINALRKMRRILIFTARKYGVCPENNSMAYEIAFPKSMYIYWIIKAQIRKVLEIKEAQ